MSVSQFTNGSFETGDYSGWTLFEDSGSPSFGTWGIATDGQTISRFESVFDFFDGIWVTEDSPGLPHTYTAAEGNLVAIQLQLAPENHRMFQDITLPSSVETISWEMEYWNHFAGFIPGSQELKVTVRNPATDAVLATLFVTTQGVDPLTIPMTTFTGDVSSFGGQTVRISVDHAVQMNWFDAAFDNFRVDITLAAEADRIDTLEDTAATINLLANDANATTVVSVTQPDHGTVTVGTGGSVTYTPALNYNGRDRFEYVAGDNFGNTDREPVSVTVTAVNDAPAATDDSDSTNEDTAVTIDLTGNDTDVEGSTLSVANLSTPASGGTLAASGTTGVVYTPALNYHGTDTFTYTANDGSADSAPATVTVTIASINDDPVALDDTGDPVVSGSSVTITVLTNDTDLDGDALSVASVGAASNGTVTINNDGTVTYTSTAPYSGTDAFSYTVSDNNGGTDTASVTVPVTAAPADADGVDNSIEDGAANSGDGNGDTIQDSTQDNVTSLPSVAGDNPGTYITLTSPTGTTLTGVSSTQDPSSGNLPDDATFPIGFLDFTINGLSNGQATVVEIFLPTGVTATGYHKYGSEPGNTTPHWYSFRYDGTTGAVITDAVIVDGIETSPTKITLHFVDGLRGDDDLTANGVLVDPGAPVVSTNKPPVATADSASLDEDGSTRVDLLANDTDADGDALSIMTLGSPTNGTLTNNGDGTVTYTPAEDFFGVDSFTYTVSDGETDAVQATVTLTVNPTPDNPVAVDDAATTTEGASVVINIFANDYDVDGEPCYLTSMDVPGGGTAIYHEDGTLTYTPNANFFGVDTFTYTISDGSGVIVQATVTVTVTGTPDAPSATADEAATAEDTAVVIAVLSNDADPDGDALSVGVFTQGAHGAVTEGADGALVYMPSADFSGSDSFTYTASDGTTESASVTVTITVTGVNDPPTFASDTVIAASLGTIWIGGQVGSDPLSTSDSYEVSFSSSATDPDDDVLTYEWELSATENFANRLLTVTASETGTSVSWSTLLDVLNAGGMEPGVSFRAYQRVVVADTSGLKAFSATQDISFIRGLFVISEAEGEVPTDVYLNPNYPNPFNPVTTIVFGLPAASSVRLALYDMSGRQVRVLIEGRLSAGIHHKRVDLGNLPSGTYVYRLTTPSRAFTKVLHLVK